MAGAWLARLVANHLQMLLHFAPEQAQALDFPVHYFLTHGQNQPGAEFVKHPICWPRVLDDAVMYHKVTHVYWAYTPKGTSVAMYTRCDKMTQNQSNLLKLLRHSASRHEIEGYAQLQLCADHLTFQKTLS